MSIIKNIQLPSGSEYPVGIFRGVCDTSAATATKDITCEHFETTDLVKGALILVTFNYDNSAAPTNLKMNVNGTGAKSLKKQTAAYWETYLSASTEIKGSTTYWFQYNGSSWVCMNIDTNTDTKNTAGSYQSTNKLYLVGATAQNNLGVTTYSNNKVYTQNGSLYATALYEGSNRVATLAALQALDSSFTAASGKVISGIGQVDGKITTVAYTDIASQSQYEAYLLWGGKNFAGSYGPIDAAMVSELGAPRTMFLKAAGITVEYSRDGGSTWTDYGATDGQRVGLFSTGSTAFYCGGTSAKGKPVGYLLRVSILTSAANIYTVLNKFVIFISTEGSSNNWCSIRARTQSNYTNNVDTWVTFADKVPITGWSGYNVINVSGITTYGNQTSQYGQVQFIFGYDTAPDSSHIGLQVYKIIGFGGVGWVTPSNMARTGHLYSWDASQNATFPAYINAVGGLAENGTFLSNKYQAKDADLTAIAGLTGTSGFLKKTAADTWTLDTTTYATSSHTHNKIVTEGDNRAIATAPNNYSNAFVFKGLKSNSTIGSPSTDTYSYLLGLRGWSDDSGGNAHELAFNNSGIYTRKGATTSWGNWAKLATTGDIPIVNNGTLTIKQNGTSIGTFSANQSSNSSVNVDTNVYWVELS